MKSKILLSLLAITLPSISYANEESEIISPITCQNESKCYFDIYDYNYTFLKRVNIDFEENELANRASFTYDYFNNTKSSEGLYSICLKSNGECKSFSNRETANIAFNNGYFPTRNKRNILVQIGRELQKQGSKALRTPSGKISDKPSRSPGSSAERMSRTAK
jgi:hypothetical protein